MIQRDISTAEKKQAFLAALQAKGSVYHACKTGGIGRTTAYRWREEDADFARGWDEAKEDAADNLEQSLYERGMTSDTTAAIFWLKGNRPEKFKDRVTAEHTGKDGGPIEFTNARERLASHLAGIAARQRKGEDSQ